jgi:hypothetical protein
MRTTRSLPEAHLPSWLKVQLRDASRRINGLTYRGVGWHLGHYHSEDFDCDSKVAKEITEEEILQTPTRTLRKLLRSERHPRADVVDLIPSKRRRDFLTGLVYGVCGEDLPEE